MRQAAHLDNEKDHNNSTITSKPVLA